MPNVLARRVEIRPHHSPNFLRLHNEGYVLWAGPIFDKHIDADISKRPFKGSVMVVKESNWDGFMGKVKTDIYIKESIWDLKKTKFIPFRTLAPFR
ncbi:YCII-related domain protein [Fusarium austroafricanum]|uniref:YCII-related domain protein n=1 Tax=Fusarium austroafricanum TaxID=2364996 RepID=A0A8H4JXW6_9HYPO|nr:YCII-related domain protein [Fusarium austroafricanum]